MLLWGTALGAVVTLLGLAYVGFIRSATGQLLDERFMRAADGLMSVDPARQGALSFLNALPEIAGVLAATGLVIAALARRSVGAPMLALVTALGAAATTQLLKLMLPRPNLGISEANAVSFPSGHTTVAAAAMIAVVLVSSPRLRPITATFGGLFTSLTAASTYVLGWHRPADVIGAVLVAGAWGLVGGYTILWREPAWNRWRIGSPTAPSGVWLAIPWIFAIVGLGTTIFLWFAVLREPPGSFEDLAAWYVTAGFGLILGATMAIFGAASALLTHQTRVRE